MDSEEDEYERKSSFKKNKHELEDELPPEDQFFNEIEEDLDSWESKVKDLLTIVSSIKKKEEIVGFLNIYAEALSEFSISCYFGPPLIFYGDILGDVVLTTQEVTKGDFNEKSILCASAIEDVMKSITDLSHVMLPIVPFPFSIHEKRIGKDTTSGDRRTLLYTYKASFFKIYCEILKVLCPQQVLFYGSGLVHKVIKALGSKISVFNGDREMIEYSARPIRLGVGKGTLKISFCHNPWVPFMKAKDGLGDASILKEIVHTVHANIVERLTKGPKKLEGSEVMNIMMNAGKTLSKRGSNGEDGWKKKKKRT